MELYCHIPWDLGGPSSIGKLTPCRSRAQTSALNTPFLFAGVAAVYAGSALNGLSSFPTPSLPQGPCSTLFSWNWWEPFVQWGQTFWGHSRLHSGRRMAVLPLFEIEFPSISENPHEIFCQNTLFPSSRERKWGEDKKVKRANNFILLHVLLNKNCKNQTYFVKGFPPTG